MTIDVARQLKVRKMLLVVNKALPSMNLEALRQKVEQAYNATVGGIFPLSEDIIKLASEGVFCVKYPDHPVTQEFQKLAQQIME